MSKKWIRRSCPPLLQYNGLCPDHFDHSQEVIRHVSTVSTIMYYKRGSQFPCSLECKIMRIHGRMYQKPFYKVVWAKCWAGATTGTFVFVRERERENQFIRRQGERRETARNVCNKLIALQFRFDVCTGIPQYKVSRESFLVVCIGQMHSLSLITLQFAFDVAGISVCHCPARLGIGSECSQSDIQRLEAIGHDRTLVVWVNLSVNTMKCFVVLLNDCCPSFVQAWAC